VGLDSEEVYGRAPLSDRKASNAHNPLLSTDNLPSRVDHERSESQPLLVSFPLMVRPARRTSGLLSGRHSTTMEDASTIGVVLHKGSMCRVEQDSQITSYVIRIWIPHGNDALCETASEHELHFSRSDFEFASRLFAILDTESVNVVHRNAVQKFVHMRCPVVSKRDDDLFRLGRVRAAEELERSPTFDEVWKAVVACSHHDRVGGDLSVEPSWIGVEGWLVFCRFIALAQYLEAKRRFSARHLQQTMRHRNSPRGSEVVVVDVPPPEPPAPITPEQLALYEQRSVKGLPLPELDLDHSLLAAHDATMRRRLQIGGYRSHRFNGKVKLEVFGSTKCPNILQQSTTSSTLEFAVTFSTMSPRCASDSLQDEVVVRRSMADMTWLNDTFTSHRVLGGTLCGRILPPFPSSSNSAGAVSSHFPIEESRFNSASIKSTTGNAIHAAAAGVGRIRDAAKSIMSPLGSYLISAATDIRSDDLLSTNTVSSQSFPNHKKVSLAKRNLSIALPENYYNPSSPEGKARQLERYLNYLLDHPALSTSFPLNAILTVSMPLEVIISILLSILIVVRYSPASLASLPHVNRLRNTPKSRKS
jgi:hypothetical protein